jgi:predicted ATPase
MTHAGENLFVVTGGPGAGKTTLLEAAAAAGYAVVPEAGRAILQRQAMIDGIATHRRDAAIYAELMLDREIENHLRHAGAGRPVLFDRGVGDLVGYRSLTGLPLGDHFDRAAERLRYNCVVFIAPPWRAIFANDAERQQDWDEAVRTCDCIRAAYQGLGYDTVELPEADVMTRLQFVTDRIGVP